MILKNLEKLENTGKISEEQKKKLIRQKRKQIKEGLTDYQVKMMNSSLWIAFQHKIEVKLLFLH